MGWYGLDPTQDRNQGLQFSNIPAVATEMFLLLYYNLSPQHVSAYTGHLQVEHNINHLTMVLSIQQVHCFVIV
jgi:hypothetical protein